MRLLAILSFAFILATNGLVSASQLKRNGSATNNMSQGSATKDTSKSPIGTPKPASSLLRGNNSNNQKGGRY